MKNKDDDTIYADDWFVDGEGRNWAVKAIDIVRSQVQLRLVDRPEKTVTFATLKSRFKLGGLRALQREAELKIAAVAKELKADEGPGRPGRRR